MRSTENAVVKAVGEAMKQVNRWLGDLRETFEGSDELGVREVSETAQPVFHDITDVVGVQIAQAYEDSYYRELYQIQTQIGRYWKVRKMSKGEINAFVSSYIKGKNWRNRLQGWYRDYARTISAVTSAGKLAGVSQEDIDALIEKETGRIGESGLSYKVMRIVRTESNNAMNSGSIRAYKAAGIKRYRIISILDDRLCRYCHEVQNGKIYRVRDAKKAVNLPPFHPNCRCYIEPVVSRDVGRELNKKGEKRRQMSYEAWRRRYAS